MRPMKLHRDTKRAAPGYAYGDSKLEVLLRTVRRNRKQGNPPNRQTIIQMMADLDITDDPVAAWRMWKGDCEPLMREVH